MIYFAGFILLSMLRNKPGISIFDSSNIFGAFIIPIPVYLLSLLLISFPIHNFSNKRMKPSEIFYGSLINTMFVILFLLAIAVSPKLHALLQEFAPNL